MGTWQGLGLNYKASSSNWASDAAYFQSIGLTNLRMHIPAVGSPWSVGTNNDNGNNAYWRDCAEYFTRRGFKVSWGLALLDPIYTDGTMTQTNWDSYATCVLAEAAYIISRGIRLEIFEISNEMERMADAVTMTRDQLITNQKQLATNIKAIPGWKASGIRVAVSMYNHNGDTYSKWITAGRGSMDIICVHPYGNVYNGGKSLSNGGYADIGAMLTAFGADNCYVNEFGLDSGSAALLTIPNELKVNFLRNRYAFIKSLGFTRAYFYTWVGYLNVNNDFALKNTDGSYSDMWDILLTDSKRRTFVN